MGDQIYKNGQNSIVQIGFKHDAVKKLDGGDIIRLPPREKLLCLDAIYGLAARLEELNCPRRQVPDWLTDTLHGLLTAGGKIVTGEGEPLKIYPGIVDDAHGDEPSCIWISEQRRRVVNPPKRRPRESMLLRLQLYDAAFRIATGRGIVECEGDQDRS